MTTRARRTKKEIEAGEVAQRGAIEMAEIGGDHTVEKVAYTEFGKEAQELERFMNDTLVIVLAHGQKEDNKYQLPMVNNKNQPIRRGMKQKVKRKYVEVLARARTETFTQVQGRADDRSSLKMVPEMVMKYPFVVVEDPSDIGAEWLRNILDQPM